jgi:hypothetical protein
LSRTQAGVYRDVLLRRWRNTLERLAVKNRVERTKQKNTVLHTAVTESAPAAEDAATEVSPAAEMAGTEEAEKVPTQA